MSQTLGSWRFLSPIDTSVLRLNPDHSCSIFSVFHLNHVHCCCSFWQYALRQEGSLWASVHDQPSLSSPFSTSLSLPLYFFLSHSVIPSPLYVFLLSSPLCPTHLPHLSFLSSFFGFSLSFFFLLHIPSLLPFLSCINCCLWWAHQSRPG